MALGLANRPCTGRHVEGRVRARPAEHELGAAAADVDYEQRIPALRAVARRAEERQPGLLVARDRARLDAVPLGELLAELLAVRRVADRARRHAHDRVGAVLVDQLAVRPDRFVHALHRRRAELARGVDPLAEPGYLRAPLEFLDAPAEDVRYEQARRVRPEIDDRDALAI